MPEIHLRRAINVNTTKKMAVNKTAPAMTPATNALTFTIWPGARGNNRSNRFSSHATKRDGADRKGSLLAIATNTTKVAKPQAHEAASRRVKFRTPSAIAFASSRRASA
jgi:hypothetical protein